MLDGLTNGASYAIKTSPSLLNPAQASKLHKEGAPRNQVNHPIYKKWKEELPVPIYEDRFRKRIQEDILALIPTSSAVESILDHGAMDGEIATQAFDSAIDSLPPGGKLIIPEGTYYLNDYTISKSLKIDCRGTLKRIQYGAEGETSSTQIIKLEAPCFWDGGIMDGNRESWMSHGFTGRHYLMKIEEPCIVKNVSGRNVVGMIDHTRLQWSGFRIENEAYLERCKTDGSSRGFNIQPRVTMFNEKNGQIDIFKGVYLYKCRADNYQRKGFGTGGTNGWVIVEDCDGNPAPYARKYAQALFIWETDADATEGNIITDMMHTVIMKKCTIKSWVQYQMIKSAQLRWMIFDHSDLTNYGITENKYPTRVYWPQTKPNTVNQIGTTVINLNSALRCVDYNDGINPYKKNAGQTFPIITNTFVNREGVDGFEKHDRVTEYYSIGGELECVVNRWWGAQHQWKIFDCIESKFIVHKTGEAFVWSDERGIEHLEKISLVDCEFIDLDGNNTWVFDSRSDIPKDSLIIINAKGNPREGLTEYPYRKSF
jgi:hypothetical protein